MLALLHPDLECLSTSRPEPLKKNWADDRNSRKGSISQRCPSDCFAHGRFVVLHELIAPLFLNIDTVLYSILSHRSGQVYEDTYKLAGELQQRISREETDGIEVQATIHQHTLGELLN